MEEGTIINNTTRDRNQNVNQAGTGNSMGIGIDNIGGIYHDSKHRNDQRKNQCNKDGENDGVSRSNDRLNIAYSNIEERNSMTMVQHAPNLDFMPNNNVNFNHQQFNAFNMSLNSADTMNNMSIPRLRNQRFIPDINASLSNTYGFQLNQNAIFPSESISTLQDNNPFTMTEDNSTPLHLGRDASDQFDGGHSSIIHGSFWNPTLAKNERSSDIKTGGKRGMGAGEVSNLPIAKRMRHARQQDHITQQIRTISDQYEKKSCRFYSLYNERDERNLSQYQCLARKQIEIFEATPEDAGNNAQGRNRPILPGQIGIRCRHCYKLPPKQRKTGSIYYPNRLEGVYQTAQKMTVGHLCKHCTMIPEEIRQRLLFLKDQKSSDGGGKRYWANCVRSLGVIETPFDGLSFAKPLQKAHKRKNDTSEAFGR